MLGLAFKPDTNDVRDTPAVPIIEQLLAEGAQVNVHDPAALDAVDELFNGAVEPCPDLPQALEHVDAVLLVTRWEEYRDVPRLLASIDSPPVLVDGRRLIEKDAVARCDGIGL